MAAPQLLLPPAQHRGALPGAPQPIGLLAIAIGNPLRSDDGVGLRLAAWLARRCQPLSPPRPRDSDRPRRSVHPGATPPCRSTLTIRHVQQLSPELADELPLCRTVLFLDAWIAPAHCQPRIVRLRPAAGELQSHRLEPETLLAISACLHGRVPQAWLLRVPADHFGHGMALSAGLRARLPRTRALLLRWLARQMPTGQVGA